MQPSTTISKSQRVIKFRAWDKKFQEMVEVSELRYSTSLGTFYPCSLKGKADVWYNPFDDQCDLLMFTGLMDKAGKEIYEHDIMALTNSDGKTRFTYVVKFEDAKFVLYHTVKQYGKWGDLHRALDPDFHDYNFCVVGNIYENPELLNP